MPNKYVVIRMTDQCNMACSWCVASASLQKHQNEKLSVMSLKTVEKIVDNALLSSIHFYIIVGGEPLVYPEEVKTFIRYICEKDPKAFISVFTNASLLSDNLVDFFNEYSEKVKIIFSVCLYGEKGLENFLEKTTIKNPIIPLVNKLKNKKIRNVMLRGQPFAIDTLALHYIFDHCEIELALDDTTLSSMSLADFSLLNTEFSKIKKLCGNMKWLEMLSAMTNKCSCTNRIGYRADGSRDDNFVFTSDVAYGCPAMINLMGSKNYNTFVTIMQNYFPPKQNNKEHGQCLL